jgi:hypothetical protein
MSCVAMSCCSSVRWNRPMPETVRNRAHVYTVSQEECAWLLEDVPYDKYVDITQNMYIQSWTVTEITAREKCGLLAGPSTVPVSWQVLSKFILECGVRWRLTLAVNCICASLRLSCVAQSAMLRQACHSCVLYSAWNPKDNYGMASEFLCSSI